MNFKRYSIIILAVVLLFSISSVCAANETINDMDQNQDIILYSADMDIQESDPDTSAVQSNDTADNSTVPGNYSNGNYSGIIAGEVSEPDSGALLNVEMDIVHDDDSLLHDYLNVDIDYNGNSYSIDNRDYFFMLRESANYNSADTNRNRNLVSVFVPDKNNIFLNVNFLNVSNQTMALYDSNGNIVYNLWKMIISFFHSLFN